MKLIKLSARLKAIVDFVDKYATVADIGTDHGHVPVYLAQTGLVKRVIASDISAASLDAARRAAMEYNVPELITFLVSSGLDGVTPTDVDTIIIAGLGSETIIQILEDAPWTKYSRVKLILQPQSKIDMLFRYLYDNGYEIMQTVTVLDNGRQYTILLIKSPAHDDNIC